jgi:hypothetical protein
VRRYEERDGERFERASQLPHFAFRKKDPAKSTTGTRQNLSLRANLFLLIPELLSSCPYPFWPE